MPTTAFTVSRIDSTPTQQDGLTLHLVQGVRLTDDLPFQVRTVNDFAAAVCARAKLLERPVSVIWKDGRFGKEIVQVDIIQQTSAA